MKTKLIAMFVSLITVGASATAFAGPACCSAAAKPGSEAAGSSATPARMMLGSYEKISNALAADDLAEAQTAARTFAAVADVSGTQLDCPVSAKEDCDAADAEKCTKSLKGVMEAKDLEEARDQFKGLSAQVIQLAANEEDYYVVSCGMSGENAEWVQSDREVRNPYQGSAMLGCGVVKPAKEAAETDG